MHPVMPEGFLTDSALDKKKRQIQFQVDRVYSNSPDNPVSYSVFAKVQHGIKVSCSFYVRNYLL